ncbi:hypothetical protein MJC1_02117 [Methylocystis sp. MJC1]|nr:hypothetical protein MJC1_02117 [Methylocystis sp. MJC1]
MEALFKALPGALKEKCGFRRDPLRRDILPAEETL